MNTLMSNLLAPLLVRALAQPLTTVSERKFAFKFYLMIYYDCPGPDGTIRCMLLNINLPSNVVNASHLFRTSNHDIASPLLQLEDVDEVKNGLLLFKPIGAAFDKFQIGFIYHPEDDSYRLKLFNNRADFKNCRLVDYLGASEVLFKRMKLNEKELAANWRSSTDPVYYPNTEYNLQTTFGDLEGKSIVFKNLNRPYQRCLNLQARVARYVARQGGTIDPGYDFKDFWSEGFTNEDKFSRYFKSMELKDK